MSLEQIYGPVRRELARADEVLTEQMRSDARFVGELDRYVLETPGKRLRPALVLLAAKACGALVDEAVQVAAAVEMMHTATLLQDDVVDGSDLRRGRATINAECGDGIAVVLGDHWFLSAFSVVLSLGRPVLLDAFLETAQTICTGELRQLVRCWDVSLAEQEYLDIIRKKTASLMAYSCRAGAFLGGASRQAARALADYGANLGIAFQIVDDCLDLAGTEQTRGKPTGKDLARGMLTLPAIYAMNASERSCRDCIERAYGSRRTTGDDVKLISAAIESCGGIEYSLRRAAHYAAIAKRELRVLNPSDARLALGALAEYVVSISPQSLGQRETA